MRNGGKRLISLLAAAAVWLLAAAPASASGAGTKENPTTVTVDAGHQRFIYANHPYNTREKLTELAGTLEGARSGGGRVDVAAKWAWEDSGWAFRPGGCAGSNYGFYQLNATSLTVPGGGNYAVRPDRVSLEVMVIAVNARQSLETASGTVARQRIDRFTGDNWKEALGLPDTVRVAYAPAQITGHPEWNAAAGEFSQRGCTYRIIGWNIEDCYAPLTPERLQSMVGQGRREIRLTPVYAAAGQGGPPAWATLEAVPRFTLTVTDGCPVDVAVTPPGGIAYGEELGDPAAEAGGVTDGGGTFTYRYVGVEGTDYDSEKKPADAGTYRVTAALDSAAYTGEGISAPFTIRRAASGSAAAELTVPTTGGVRTVYLGSIGLPDGMAQGARLKAAPDAAAGEVLAGVTGAAGEDCFTLNVKPVQAGSAQSFSLVLTSRNYEELTVDITVAAAANADGFQLTRAAVKEPGVFEYGTPLRDIIDLERCAAILNGMDAPGGFVLTEPDRRYGVGEDTTIQIQFQSGGGTYQAEVPAEFTIKPAELTFLGWDEAFIRDGYWITTYANSPYNTDAGMLRTLVQDRKRTFTASYAGGELELDARWSAVAGSPPFEPAGQKPHQVDDVVWYDWYGYTAALTPRNGDAKNFALDVQPKAYIRVVPVNAAPVLESRSKTVQAAALADLAEKNWAAVLDLPETVSVSYQPVERPEWSDEYSPEPDGAYAIAGWKLDGLVLTPADLRARAAEAVNGNVRLTLTPVCDVPAWATVQGGMPTFQLTATPGTPVDARPKASAGGGSTITSPPGEHKTTVVTGKDGAVTTTMQNKDGSCGTTVTDASGQTAAIVRLPFEAADGAVNGSPVTLPIPGVCASQDIGRAPAVTVDTSGVNGVQVNIPVVNKGAGVVAVLVKADGAGQIIRNTAPTREGIAIRVNSGDTIKILDNRKPFEDTRDHWAADAADFASSRELFKGAASGVFSPDAGMTRGMLVTVLARYENVDTGGGAAWYEKGAAWAMDKGLSDGTRLDDNITREQLAAIMYRYAILKGRLSGAGARLSDYADAHLVSGWAADAMSWAVGAGLIKGATATQLDPRGSATRAQVAAVMMRFAEIFGP